MAARLSIFLLLAAGTAANAQFKELGAAPLSETAARQQFRSLLARVTPDDRDQTVKTITALLPWYRDLADEELIAAWKGENRPNLPEVMEALADARLASAVVEFSWRQGRPDAFQLAYAPLLEHLMARYPASARPFLDDIVQFPSLSAGEAAVVCRILLDMRDVGTWKQTALQVLPHYRRTVDALLAQDAQNPDREKAFAAQRWQTDLRPPDSTPAPRRTVQAATSPPPPLPAQSSALVNRNPGRPTLHMDAGETLMPLDPAMVDDQAASKTGVSSLLDFVNQTAGPVDIYWINFNGDRVPYFSGLKPGATWRVRTFTNHYWLVVASGSGGSAAQDSGTRIAGFQPVTPDPTFDPAKRDTAVIAPAPLPAAPTVSTPTISSRVEPQFTPIARKLNVAAATVVLSAVVQPDGTVGDVKVTKPVGYGLDEKATEALRQWRFNPAMKDGAPVAARTNITFNFRLSQIPGKDLWQTGPMVFALYPETSAPEVIDGSVPKRSGSAPAGDVVLEFTVDPAGAVKNIHPVQGAESASDLVASVASWKFHPAMKGSEPVEATGRVTFNAAAR